MYDVTEKFNFEASKLQKGLEQPDTMKLIKGVKQ